MKITYTGKFESLSDAQSQKIEAKFAKLAKLLDARQGEREAHVILTSERHIHTAEITVHYRDHDLVGFGASAEIFPAVCDAIDKLEKQILRLREKRRDMVRGPKDIASEAERETPVEAPPRIEARTAAEVAGGEDTPGRRVFRVNHHERRKPMTLEEALIEIDERDYVVYRDAESSRVSVLVRRRDGNFDLIEA